MFIEEHETKLTCHIALCFEEDHFPQGTMMPLYLFSSLQLLVKHSGSWPWSLQSFLSAIIALPKIGPEPELQGRRQYSVVVWYHASIYCWVSLGEGPLLETCNKMQRPCVQFNLLLGK